MLLALAVAMAVALLSAALINKRRRSQRCDVTAANDDDVADNVESQRKLEGIDEAGAVVPLSVNYHFTRVCNYSCGFCFHTSLVDGKLALDQAKLGLRQLRDAGMQKINFAGGEPFLYASYLGELVRYCHQELKLSVSIVSNGSKITRRWFEKYGQHVAILAVSCDSFDEQVNRQIGRGAGNKSHVDQVYVVKELCDEFNVRFKINSVVNHFNWQEDMTDHIKLLAPFRWKVFQVLVIEGENSGDTAKRDASKYVVTDEEFEHFISTHKSLGSVVVPESNTSMRNSYLILDEEMRFLDCSGGQKQPSESLLKVGVGPALKQSGFDPEMFARRGGKYDWTRVSDASPSRDNVPACTLPKQLEW